jgi:hypothetical protein
MTPGRRHGRQSADAQQQLRKPARRRRQGDAARGDQGARQHQDRRGGCAIQEGGADRATVNPAVARPKTGDSAERGITSSCSIGRSSTLKE